MATKYELLKQERDVLYNQMITSLNGISVPVNRMMTKKERIKFKQIQPEWCQYIWALNGTDYRIQK